MRATARRFFFAMLLLMAALRGSAMTYVQDNEFAVAEQLIRSMRTDQFAVQGALAAYLNKPDPAGEAGLTDGQRRGFLNCLEGADTSLIVRVLSGVLMQLMSLGEMQQALDFYGSSAGKKQVLRDLADAQKIFGYELPVASPELSPEERASLDRFRGTLAYAKLQEFPARIKKASEIRKAILRESEVIATTCSQAVGLRS